MAVVLCCERGRKNQEGGRVEMEKEGSKAPLVKGSKRHITTPFLSLTV
jgi:hypothetical protein